MDSLIQLLKQKYPFIVVEGVIGVGKTTLATLIAKELHNELVLETFEKIIDDGKKVSAEWHYNAEDDDIILAGQEFDETLDIDFEFHPIY